MQLRLLVLMVRMDVVLMGAASFVGSVWLIGSHEVDRLKGSGVVVLLVLIWWFD